MTPELLIQTIQLPHSEQLVKAAAIWLQPLGEQYDAFQILDLAYLEQRLGCFMPPTPMPTMH